MIMGKTRLYRAIREGIIAARIDAGFYGFDWRGDFGGTVKIGDEAPAYRSFKCYSVRESYLFDEAYDRAYHPALFSYIEDADRSRLGRWSLRNQLLRRAKDPVVLLSSFWEFDKNRVIGEENRKDRNG